TAGSGITEGGSASFTVTASPAPASALTVTITVTQTGDYAAPGTTGSKTVVIPTGGSKTYTVATTNDGVDEANGSVKVTLNAGSGYSVSSSHGAASVTVADDDVPEISVTADSGITEGGSASFTVTASPAPASALTVTITVTQTGDYAAPGTTGSKTVVIPTGGSKTYTVATTNDGVDEANGSVKVTLNAGSGYSVSSSHGAASVTVADDDVPEISVTADSGITEGGSASFTVTASPAPASALTVKLTVTQSGDYAASGTTGSKTVIIPTGGSVSYTVATVNDSADEANGSVKVTLNAGSGYTISSQGSASVSVADDDDPPPPSARPTIKVHAASGDEDSEEIRFKVTLSEASTEKVTVYWRTYNASGQPNPARGSYTGQSRGDDYVYSGGWITFEPGQTVKHGDVWVLDDSVREEDEVLEVWLSAANGADIEVDTALMTIIDDD
ncbi:MAG: hypothetical protein OXG61_05040, partial [Chloroflexi bacterium]|nr:hypothetical protein [Chloroflexota bacterium]